MTSREEDINAFVTVCEAAQGGPLCDSLKGVAAGLMASTQIMGKFCQVVEEFRDGELTSVAAMGKVREYVRVWQTDMGMPESERV